MATYYVKNGGDDTKDGLSDGNAWETLSHAEDNISSGDTLLFKRGDTFRGFMTVPSGTGLDDSILTTDTSGYTTIGAYGTGDKPKILTAVTRNDTDQWTDEGSNIWNGNIITPIGDSLTPNSTFEVNDDGWRVLLSEDGDASGARTTDQAHTGVASYGLNIVDVGSGEYRVLMSTDVASEYSVIKNKVYVANLWVKGTAAFDIRHVNFGWTNNKFNNKAYWNRRGIGISVTTDWTEHSIYFKADDSFETGMLSIVVQDTDANGQTLYIDDITLKLADNQDAVISSSGGLLVINDEESVGNNVQLVGELAAQGDTHFDWVGWTFKMYSVGNPATVYNNLEVGQFDVTIEPFSYTIVENLDIRYTTNLGVNVTNGNHIIVRDCNFSYIGGGQPDYSNKGEEKLGNAMQFWNGASQCLVERNRIDNIYDAGMTNQGSSEATDEYLYYFNNIVTNCEYSYEGWERHASSIINNVYVEYNTFKDAGKGWGHTQRYDSVNAAHIDISTLPIASQVTDFWIRNNVFHSSTERNIWWQNFDDIGVDFVQLDYNCFYGTEGYLARLGNFGTPNYEDVAYADYADYQTTTGQDANSVFADPVLTLDFMLKAASPCINAGINLPSVDKEYRGYSRKLVPDIGAYEYVTGFKNCTLNNFVIS